MSEWVRIGRFVLGAIALLLGIIWLRNGLTGEVEVGWIVAGFVVLAVGLILLVPGVIVAIFGKK